jgi:DtxR family Mn-dependent transcriptional regulator
MSDKVERKILGLIGEGYESPYGNPIPGLDELGIERAGDAMGALVSFTDAAGSTPTVVTVRRIGEPVQVDPEALSLLTSAGVLPGARVEVVREAGRVIAVREGADRSAGVSLPDDVAVHVLGETS